MKIKIDKKNIPFGIFMALVLIITSPLVSAAPLSDQQHSGNILNTLNIINQPPTYTINDVYYYQDVGMCKANTKCSYLYAGIPAVVYIWVDSTSGWGQKYNLYGSTTTVSIIGHYHNTLWGQGTAKFLDENTYIKVPVLVDIPLSEIGEAQSDVYQNTLDAGGNVHYYTDEDFYIMGATGYGLRAIEPLPSGTIVQPRPGNRLVPMCSEIFANPAYLVAIKSVDTNKDNKISDAELLTHMENYLWGINNIINKDESQAVIDCWTNDCTIPTTPIVTPVVTPVVTPGVTPTVTTPTVTTVVPAVTTPAFITPVVTTSGKCLTGYVYDPSTDICVKIQTSPGFDSTVAIVAIIGIAITAYITLRRKRKS